MFSIAPPKGPDALETPIIVSNTPSTPFFFFLFKKRKVLILPETPGPKNASQCRRAADKIYITKENRQMQRFAFC